MPECSCCGKQFTKTRYNRVYCSKKCQGRFATCNSTLAWLRYIKYRARKKNIEFNLDQSDIVIPALCPILGIPLVRNYKGFQNDSPSLDRIDNSKGYVKGNVRVISNRANKLKLDATLEELERILEDARTIHPNPSRGSTTT